jgi:pimeloyl-ACP methyl ester carboxylesterase
LFHSSPFSDTETKKQARTDTIKKIHAGSLTEICETHVRKVYADENINAFETHIRKAESTAKKMSREAVISSVEAMRDRKDRSEIFGRTELPAMYIIGLKDNFIKEGILDFISFPEKHRIIKLERSGHMGMIEEKEKSLKAINDFCNDYIV